MPFNNEIVQVSDKNINLINALLEIFGEDFQEVETYTGNTPSASYIRQLLSVGYCVPLVAFRFAKTQILKLLKEVEAAARSKMFTVNTTSPTPSEYR